ncbi:MAG TPA: transaldolase family protein [Dehalococcoidia bacterium]|nr:transaldolase family protein [Dehalococcoidia bacterium]
MEIFADTADLAEIRLWLHYGVVDGVTTNPSIMLGAGAYNGRQRTIEIAALLGNKPLSVEVVSDDPAEMVEQARDMATWADNLVIKIPVITTQGQPCLGAIRELTQAGIRVNATACLSFGQALLAAKAGATYVSLFAGRISDEGGNASAVIRSVAEWLRHWSFPTKIIVGSIREVSNIQEAALAGAHVVTVPPKFLHGLVDHKYSRFTVQQFLSDGQAAQERLLALELERQGPSGSPDPALAVRG